MGAFARVALQIQHAIRRNIVICGLSVCTTLSDMSLSHNQNDFPEKKKKAMNIKRVF
jgi:hypothetical protein